MRELLPDPEAADFVWRRLQYVFKFPDPRAFPALGISWNSDELEMLERFITQAERLAEASLISADDRITIDIADDGQSEDIDAQMSATDLTFGFVALFRQCYVHDEDVSFARVRKLLQIRLHERGEAGLLDVLKLWRRAHAKLDGNTLEELVQERMVAEGLMPPEIVQAPASPRARRRRSNSMGVGAPVPPAVRTCGSLGHPGPIRWQLLLRDVAAALRPSIPAFAGSRSQTEPALSRRRSGRRPHSCGACPEESEAGLGRLREGVARRPPQDAISDGAGTSSPAPRGASAGRRWRRNISSTQR